MCCVMHAYCGEVRLCVVCCVMWTVMRSNCVALCGMRQIFNQGKKKYRKNKHKKIVVRVEHSYCSAFLTWRF